MSRRRQHPRIPGVFLRSVYPTGTGTLVPGTRSSSPIRIARSSERWGGWYVTGAPAEVPHMGNATVDGASPEAPRTVKRPPRSFRRCRGGSTPRTYLSPDSDVVAHLVLAHQTQMHNLITLTNYKTRLALYAGKAARCRRQAGDNSSGRPSSWCATCCSLTKRRSTSPSPVRPDSPRSSQRAVRAMTGDVRCAISTLAPRIFKYPCSYLIYSEAFDAIPAAGEGSMSTGACSKCSPARTRPRFASLSAEDRRAILEILVATKPGVPEEWKEFVKHPDGAQARIDINPTVQKGH